MSNRIKCILFLLILIAFAFLIIGVGDIHCVFKSFFHIPCPGCGMTRAFIAIFNMQILDAIYQNLLAIPLAVFLVFSVLCLVRDLIYDTNHYFKNTIHLLTKYSSGMIIAIIVSFLWNVITNK